MDAKWEAILDGLTAFSVVILYSVIIYPFILWLGVYGLFLGAALIGTFTALKSYENRKIWLDG